jgi:hypothetical protein
VSGWRAKGSDREGAVRIGLIAVGRREFGKAHGMAEGVLR